MFVELAPDSLDDQIEDKDDDEVEHDEPVHLLANLGLWAEGVVVVSPVESDHQQDCQDEDAGQDQSDVQSYSGILPTNLKYCQELLGMSEVSNLDKSQA